MNAQLTADLVEALPARTMVNGSQVRTARTRDGWLTVIVRGPLDGEEFRSRTEREARAAHAGAVWLVRGAGGA